MSKANQTQKTIHKLHQHAKEAKECDDALALIAEQAGAANEFAACEAHFAKATVDKVATLRAKVHTLEGLNATLKNMLSAVQAERDEYKALAEANEVKKLQRRLREAKEEVTVQLRKERADMAVRINKADIMGRLAQQARLTMGDDVHHFNRLLTGLAEKLGGLGASKTEIEEWAKQIRDAVARAESDGTKIDEIIHDGKLEPLEGVVTAPEEVD